jgi:iron(III) transport system substrate-binding protein
MKLKILPRIALIFCGQFLTNTFALAAQLNVYSSRHYDIDKEIIASFEQKTGHKVNVIQMKEAGQLIERLKTEGAQSQADVLMTVDVGNLERASSLGLFDNKSLEKIIKDTLPQTQDEKKEWVALTVRARVIAYNKALLKPEEVETYESLASEKFKKKVLVRSSNHVYNQSLLSSFLENIGEAKAKSWAIAIQQNLARKPEGGDTDQMKAIASGIGDVSIVNSYYFARAFSQKPGENSPEITSKVGIVFPNQKTTGTHINVSGAGVLKNSTKKDIATAFIAHWLSIESQEKLSLANYEYPAIANAKLSPLLSQFGSPKFDTLPLSKVARSHAKAVKLFDEIGWR